MIGLAKRNGLRATAAQQPNLLLRADHAALRAHLEREAPPPLRSDQSLLVRLWLWWRRVDFMRGLR